MRFIKLFIEVRMKRLTVIGGSIVKSAAKAALKMFGGKLAFSPTQLSTKHSAYSQYFGLS